MNNFDYLSMNEYWKKGSYFLPGNESPKCLIAPEPIWEEYCFKLDTLAEQLSGLISHRKVREELVAGLREVNYALPKNWGAVVDPTFNLFAQFTWADLERLMTLYSYFASAYVYAPEEAPIKRIPKEIAVPLYSLAIKLGRKPILSYASYCLTNWWRIDAKKPIELGNIGIRQNFTRGPERRDEDWFILVHVEIEAKAVEGVEAISNSLRSVPLENVEAVKDQLETIDRSLRQMKAALDRMPERCSPEVYFKKVRPYIFGFEDVVYEGVSDDPKSYRGETGAQSSAIPAFQIALGIKHEKSELTKHLRDMREYMPIPHREFLWNLEKQVRLRLFAKNNSACKEPYNKCVRTFSEFRKKHLQYAVDYIQKKVKDPKGTGGTPYIPWLTQLTEETEDYLL